MLSANNFDLVLYVIINRKTWTVAGYSIHVVNYLVDRRQSTEWCMFVDTQKTIIVGLSKRESRGGLTMNAFHTLWSLRLSHLKKLWSLFSRKCVQFKSFVYEEICSLWQRLREHCVYLYYASRFICKCTHDVDVAIPCTCLVCLWHSDIVSKRLNILPDFFHCHVAQSLQYLRN